MKAHQESPAVPSPDAACPSADAWPIRSQQARAHGGGVAFWSWRRTRRVRCFVDARALEALAGRALSEPDERLAVYAHHRKRIHRCAQAEAAFASEDAPVVVTAPLLQG